MIRSTIDANTVKLSYSDEVFVVIQEIGGETKYTYPNGIYVTEWLEKEYDKMYWMLTWYSKEGKFLSDEEVSTCGHDRYDCGSEQLIKNILALWP